VTDPKLQPLTVFLLKPNAANGLTRYGLPAGPPFKGTLRLRPEISREPPWISFVCTGLIKDLTALTASSSAVLMLEASDRVFTLTFGNGRWFLKPASYGRDFVLGVALNAQARERPQPRCTDVRGTDASRVPDWRLWRDSRWHVDGLCIQQRPPIESARREMHRPAQYRQSAWFGRRRPEGGLAARRRARQARVQQRSLAECLAATRWVGGWRRRRPRWRPDDRSIASARRVKDLSSADRRVTAAQSHGVTHPVAGYVLRRWT
jgi:hypothetical protein